MYTAKHIHRIENNLAPLLSFMEIRLIMMKKVGIYSCMYIRRFK
jgi:hypothetical protein